MPRKDLDEVARTDDCPFVRVEVGALEVLLEDCGHARAQGEETENENEHVREESENIIKILTHY